MPMFPSRPAQSLDFKEVGYEKKDFVARVTIRRPQNFNAYSTPALRELAAAFTDAAEDDAVAVIVYTGEGTQAFCTGGDVKEYEREYTSRPRDYWKYMGLFKAYIESILNSGKPVIARINGMAVGGGNESVLACDLAVMAEHAYLGQVGTSVGSVACGGATQWLPIVVGDKRAREMLFLNPRIPARQALEWGLVNRVAPSVKKDGAFVEKATKEQIALRPEGRRRLRHRPVQAGRGGGRDLRPGHRQVRGVHALHQAAGELLEGPVVAFHGRPRQGLALGPLLRLGTRRGHGRLRGEAQGRLPRHAPASRGREIQRVPVGRPEGGVQSLWGQEPPRGRTLLLRLRGETLMDRTMEGRCALVTGAARGIGAAIARELARQGAKVALLDLRIEGPLSELAAELASTGGEAVALAADVASFEEVGRAVGEARDRLGGLHILVNNAGINRDAVLWKMEEASWDAVLDVNLKGAFNTLRHAAPILREAGWGRVVNVASINGLRGKFGQANYGASKAGLIGLTKAAAKELGRFGVTVNAVAPGLIETEMVAAMPEEARRKSLEEIVLGHMGQPEDVAAVVAFLCSEGARHITGEVIRVDGGQAM